VKRQRPTEAEVLAALDSALERSWTDRVTSGEVAAQIAGMSGYQMTWLLKRCRGVDVDFYWQPVGRGAGRQHGFKRA
jgi:hypothetical protein